MYSNSIFLVVLFSKKVKNTRIIRMIQLLAEAAFSVFLIHVHPFVKEFLFVDRFK